VTIVTIVTMFSATLFSNLYLAALGKRILWILDDVPPDA